MSLTLQTTSSTLNPEPTWGVPIDAEYEPNMHSVQHFTQNGYDLCALEQEYAAVNLSPTEKVRWRTAIKQPWLTHQNTGTVHVNHADLYERKGYHGEALAQLNQYASRMPILYKIIHMKPKWGIDISIDHADKHGAYEVFHYEWDDFDYAAVLHKKMQIQQLVLSIDWEDFAKTLWKIRDRWWHLDYIAQSKFKTDLLGIEPERYKLTVW